MNPAVSIAFAIADRFEFKLLPPYIISQLTGAIMASLTLKLFFLSKSHLGSNIAHRHCHAILRA